MGREEFSRPLPGDQHRTIGALTSQIHTLDPLGPEAYSHTTGTAEVNPGDDRTRLQVTDDGDKATLLHAAIPHKYTSGRLVLEFVWQTNRSFGGLDNEMEIGSINNALASANDNTVAFRPHFGNSTDGNIVVDSESADPVTGSFDYPSISDSAHYYCIVIDFDDGETRFHVDSNPFVSDGTVIEAVPDRVSHPGGRNTWNGSGFDQLSFNTIGYRYVP